MVMRSSVVATYLCVVVKSFILSILKMIQKLAIWFYEQIIIVIVSCAIVHGLWLPTLLFPFLLLVFYRKFLSVLLSLCSGGKWRLMDAADAAHTFDSYANVNTITFFLYLDGPVDLEELQARVEKCVYLKRRKDDSQPYWKLRHVPRRKWGFMCWQDRTRFFDVQRHVKYMPDFDRRDKIYEEKAVQENIAALACEPWPGKEPKWEFLIVPQIETEQGEVRGCLVVRISHEYGDGISIMQMFRQNVFDKPSPLLLLDPVNPPWGKPKLYQRLAANFQTFIWGPSAIFKFLGFKAPERYTPKGLKYLGRQKMEIHLDQIRRIRKHFGVSTSAIFHSCFCGALRVLSKEYGAPIPRTAVGGMAYGLLPYPNDHLQNHFTPLADKYPVDISDPIKRVRKIEGQLRRVVKPYSIMATHWIYSLMGMLPAPLIKAALSVVDINFVVSNVPGLVGNVRFGGYPVTLIWGCPPSCKGIQYTIGVGCFNKKFILGFLVDQTFLVQSNSDLESFISAFENEIQVLINKMNG